MPERDATQREPLLDRPKFAAAIGVVVSQASYLEAQLADLFCEIAGTDPTRGELIYWAFPTFHQRRKMMQRLLAETPLPFGPRAKAIIKRAAKFMARRNEVVHDMWVPSDDGSSPMVRYTANVIRDKDEKFVEVWLAEVREIGETAMRINADLATLIEDIQTGRA